MQRVELWNSIDMIFHFPDGIRVNSAQYTYIARYRKIS